MISYDDIKILNGVTCYTLTHNKPAIMEVDDKGVTITYPTNSTLFIPKAMFEDAILQLNRNGILTMEHVHEKITKGDGPRTDRLLAILRASEKVTFTSKPRTLRLRGSLS